MKRSIATFAAAGALMVLAVTPQPAKARINCQGPYQVVQGSLIITPYCSDNHLAYVANRFYGMHVSAAAVRHNPNIKEEVCRLVGTDSRVLDACAGFLSYGGRSHH